MSAVETSPGDFAISGTGVASVKNSALATALVKDTDEAVKLISENAPSVSVSEISIDDCGRIVIDNDEFKGFVNDMISNPVGAVGQGICGYGCAGL